MGIEEKIKEIEEEIKKTKKNKATEKHLGLLKAKLAKLRRSTTSSKKGGGFAVPKSGNATVVFVGFPSSGKSTLLSKITNAESKSAHYAFTTVSVVPGMLYYKGAKIQVLDLPGILKGASYGKGRGREIISVARSADLILLVLDGKQSLSQLNAIVGELYNMGIRLNSSPKQIFIEKKYRGGIEVITHLKKLSLDKKTIEAVLREYGIHNAFITIREEISVDELIDALESNRTYIKAFVVINKVDLLNKEEISKISEELKKLGFPYIFISAQHSINLDKLKEMIFESLDFIRIYTKPQGEEKSKEPLILKKGSTIREVCRALHKDILKNFKFALVSGKSVKFNSQRVGLDHVLEDNDVVTIVYERS